MSSNFFSDMQGYAIGCSAALNIPFEVILCQWALESQYGESDLCKRANNFGGIKYTKNADYQSGAYAGYNSIGSFAKDYIRVMSLDYYQPVRNAGGILDTINAFAYTPYAEDGQYSSKLRSIYETNFNGGNKIPIPGGGGASVSFAGIGHFFLSPWLWIPLFLVLLFKRPRKGTKVVE